MTASVSGVIISRGTHQTRKRMSLTTFCFTALPVFPLSQLKTSPKSEAKPKSGCFNLSAVPFRSGDPSPRSVSCLAWPHSRVRGGAYPNLRQSQTNSVQPPPPPQNHPPPNTAKRKFEHTKSPGMARLVQGSYRPHDSGV